MAGVSQNTAAPSPTGRAIPEKSAAGLSHFARGVTTLVLKASEEAIFHQIAIEGALHFGRYSLHRQVPGAEYAAGA
jgi:hypothetical protein